MEATWLMEATQVSNCPLCYMIRLNIRKTVYFCSMHFMQL